MNKHSMIFIGLDTHKEFHEVAYCEEKRGATPVHYGRIPSSKVSVKKLIRQFELNIRAQQFMWFMKQDRVVIGFIV